jgi:hypothetical protein
VSKFTDTELKRLQWGGGIVAAVGLLVGLITKLPYPPTGFWIDYIEGCHDAGWIAFIFGAAWAGLASAHRHTQFFSLDRPMSLEHAALSLAGIVIAVSVACVVLVPKLPDTDPSKMPPDQNVRDRILRREGNFRKGVIFVLIATGGIVAFYPCRKFMRG